MPVQRRHGDIAPEAWLEAIGDVSAQPAGDDPSWVVSVTVQPRGAAQTSTWQLQRWDDDVLLLRELAPTLAQPNAYATAEQTLQLQRHLHDREQRFFTSRSVSIGEMASTLAHEIKSTRRHHCQPAAWLVDAAGSAGGGC